MKLFSIGPLGQWQPIATGKVIEFEVPRSAAHRSVTLDFMADRPVQIYAATPENDYLVATGEGHMRCMFKAHENFGLTVIGDPDAAVYIQTRDAPAIIAESDEPSMTDLSPRPAGPTEEVARMMRMLQLREQARQEAFEEQMQALRDAPIPTASAGGTVTADPKEEGGDVGTAE